MGEFQERIPIGRGKLEFKHGPNGTVSMGISSSSGSFRAMYQIAVGFDGRPLAVVPFTGLGAPFPPYPKPSVLAWIMSDEQGMWGRRCPSCTSYFRTIHVNGRTWCPYCSFFESSLAFITEAQGHYVEAFCNALLRAQKGPDDVTIDLAEVTDDTPEWKYTEEQLQFHFECPACHTKADILGDYGFCPQCGKTNSTSVVDSKFAALQRKFEESDKTIQGRSARGDEWERLNTACFSEFESVGNHVRKRLLLIPSTPSRKNDLRQLSFQRVVAACEFLERSHGINPLEGLAQDDLGFLNLMLHRRHINIHNGGKADDNYLLQSGDSSARLNERVRIRSSQARRVIGIVERMTKKLAGDFASLA